MRNRDKWAPSKYVYKGKKLIGSREIGEVAVASRLITDLVAAHYDKYIASYVRGRLVDLGCGKVPLFAAYKDHITTNVCVEWGNTSHRVDYVDLQCDLTMTLPFSDGQFDTVILSDVLEHVPQPEILWNEMARILSPNGRVLMSVPFCYWIHEEPHDYYRYTEFALRRFAKMAGFNVLVLKPVGGAPEILTDILAKNVLRIPSVGKHLSASIQWFASLFLKTSLGQRISEATSESFPLEYFLVAEKCTERG